MSVSLDALKAFQARDLEVIDETSHQRRPVQDKVLEWALVEIVVLLNGIRDTLARTSTRRARK